MIWGILHEPNLQWVPVLGTLAALLGLFQPCYPQEQREACCTCLVRQLQRCRLLLFQSVLLKDLRKAAPELLFLWLLLGGYNIADRPTCTAAILDSCKFYMVFMFDFVLIWALLGIGLRPFCVSGMVIITELPPATHLQPSLPWCLMSSSPEVDATLGRF